MSIGWAQDVAPESRTALWGARAILERDGFVDLLPDRQSLIGEDEAEKNLLIDMLNSGIIREIREVVPVLMQHGVIRPDEANPVVLHMDDRLIVVANTNGSYGYLYLTAFLMPA